ncbi:AAA family ATPase, partial [Methylobacterium sp. E-005]|uniref:AAA family ATPase n=1 Tax=Methylobacterium sp. E-005 TaxID=2836549 RepID=UPI001FB8C676
KDDAVVLQHLTENLKRVVYGQPNAIEALTSAIKLARAGLPDPDKPIGSYLVAGPTGAGKTNAAKQLSASLGGEMLRVDMSEYMVRHTVSHRRGAALCSVGSDQGCLLADGGAHRAHARQAAVASSVDGKQVGGVRTAHASRAAGQSDAITVNGDWASGSHTVAVNFLNDASGGTASLDRNLYVDSATYNGASVADAHFTMLSQGAQTFTFFH